MTHKRQVKFQNCNLNHFNWRSFISQCNKNNITFFLTMNMKLNKKVNQMTKLTKDKVIQLASVVPNNYSFIYKHIYWTAMQWSRTGPFEQEINFQSPLEIKQIYRWFLIHSCDNLSQVIPNNKTLEHWRLKVLFIALSMQESSINSSSNFVVC